MFKTIRNYIRAFKDAYKTINSKKFEAKEAIDKYKLEVDNIKNVYTVLRDTYEGLDAVYKYLPKQERRDFIQKTLDLLKFGRTDVDENGDRCFKDLIGYIYLYFSQYTDMSHFLKVMRLHYNNGHYDDVIDLAREYGMQLENFYVNHDIK